MEGLRTGSAGASPYRDYVPLERKRKKPRLGRGRFKVRRDYCTLGSSTTNSARRFSA